MSNQKTATASGFVKDENGQFQLVPLKLPEFMKGSTVKKREDGSTQKQVSTRKYIPLDKFVFTPADFEVSPGLSKRHKIDAKIVRKNLFKEPPKKKENRLSSIKKRDSILKTAKNGKIKLLNKKLLSAKTSQNIIQSSPLLDIEICERMMNKGSMLRKPPKTIIPSMVSIPETTDATIINNSDIGTDEVNDSFNEYLEIEKTLLTITKVPESNQTQSPMSSVYNPMKNNKLKKCGIKSIVEEASAIIMEDQNRFKTLTEQFETYKKQHQINLDKIKKLICQLESCDDDKENQNKSVKKKTVDLRKQTKNLKKDESESPRMKKAVDLYNNFRSECSILCTPKLDKTSIEMPINSVRRSLSRKIQKQCLMLQDTPR